MGDWKSLRRADRHEGSTGKKSCTARCARNSPQNVTASSWKAVVGGHKVFLRTGEYENGELGEIFYRYVTRKALRSAACWTASQSLYPKRFQYGMPAWKNSSIRYVYAFEPAGIVIGHEAIKNCNLGARLYFPRSRYEYLGMTGFRACKIHWWVIRKTPSRVSTRRLNWSAGNRPNTRMKWKCCFRKEKMPRWIPKWIMVANHRDTRGEMCSAVPPRVEAQWFLHGMRGMRYHERLFVRMRDLGNYCYKTEHQCIKAKR